MHTLSLFLTHALIYTMATIFRKQANNLQLHPLWRPKLMHSQTTITLIKWYFNQYKYKEFNERKEVKDLT